MHLVNRAVTRDAGVSAQQRLSPQLLQETLGHLVRIVQSPQFMADKGKQDQAKREIIAYLGNNLKSTAVRAALGELIPTLQSMLLESGLTRNTVLAQSALDTLYALALDGSQPALTAMRAAVDEKTETNLRDNIAEKLRDLAYAKPSSETIAAIVDLILSDKIEDHRKYETGAVTAGQQSLRLVYALMHLVNRAVTRDAGVSAQQRLSPQLLQETLGHLVRIVQSPQFMEDKGKQEQAKQEIVKYLAANTHGEGVVASLVEIMTSKEVPAEVQQLGAPGLMDGVQNNPALVDNVTYFVVTDNYFRYIQADNPSGIFAPESFERYREWEKRGLLEIRRLIVNRNVGAVRKGLEEGKYTQEQVVQAIILNNFNNIITQTSELILTVLEQEIRRKSRNKKGIMEGMVSLKDKLTGTPYANHFNMQSLQTGLSTYGITTVDAALLEKLGWRVLADGLIVPYVFDVLLSTYRGHRVIDSVDASYLTHSITTAIIKYGLRGGEFGSGEGANAIHEFDQGLLNLLGDNGRRVDDNVSLAFSYPPDKAMPDYTRKRTVPLRGNTVLGHILQFMEWQLKERRAKQNILKVLQLIVEGKLSAQKLPAAVEFIKSQLAVLRNECGFRTYRENGIEQCPYFDVLFGSLTPSFYQKLQAKYIPGVNNRALLNKLLIESMKGFRAIHKMPRAGQSERRTADHPWLSAQIHFSRDRTETLTLLNYLENEEYIRRETFDKVDVSDEISLGSFTATAAELAEATIAHPSDRQSTTAQAKTPSSGKTITIFFAGRITPEKGAEDFVRLLSDVQARYKGPGITIRGRVLGSIDKEYQTQLEEIARVNGITDLAFAGEYSPESFVETLNSYNRQECIFVHTFGLVTREAMAMGFPVVSSDRAAARGTCRVPKAQYVAAIADLIDHPEKREELTRDARQEAEQSFGAGQWLAGMMAAIERVTGRPLGARLRAYFTFSGFGYGKHGVNEYYNKFFRYLAKKKDVQPETDVVSMQQRFFLDSPFPQDMYVPGVFEAANMREFNTYQHIGKRKIGREPENAVLSSLFLPALKDLIACIRAMEFDSEKIFKPGEDSGRVAEKALAALMRLQDYFAVGYDVAKTMLDPAVVRLVKGAFPSRDDAMSSLQANMVSYDKMNKPADHFAKLITLMYMLSEKMPEGKDVSFTCQLFPPILNILHRQRGGPPVIYIEHTRYGHNEQAIVKNIDEGKYPPAVKQFMKQYVALLKLLMVHYVDGYINPWNTEWRKITDYYGELFRGQNIHLPHGVDTGLYMYQGSPADAQASEAAPSRSVDFAGIKSSLTLSPHEGQPRQDLVTTVKDAIQITVSNRARVLVQGSVGRSTDLPGRFDIDFIALFNTPLQGDQQGRDVMAAITDGLRAKGYEARNVQQRPHNGNQWLISFVIFNAQGVSVTKAEVTLASQNEAYPDLFNRQISQIEARFGDAGRESVLADIRLMKHILQNVIASYKWYHGGLSGIGAEQLIIQSGGATVQGRNIVGLGSFIKAMEWIYKEGYDAQSGAIRSLAEAKRRFVIYNVTGVNFLDNLNEWSWRRLVHAARAYVEGKQQGDIFSDTQKLRYTLTVALEYRKDARQAVSFDFRGNADELVTRSFSGRPYQMAYERVGETKYYLFLTAQESRLEDILASAGAYNITVASSSPLIRQQSEIFSPLEGGLGEIIEESPEDSLDNSSSSPLNQVENRPSAASSALDLLEVGHPDSPWFAIVKERWRQGVDFNRLFGADRLLIIADTDHECLGIQRGLVERLDDLKNANVTHLLLEIPSEMPVEEIEEIAQGTRIPHRFRQLVVDAQARGIQVEFMDMPAQDQLRYGMVRDIARGVYIGLFIAGFIKAHPQAKVIAATGFGHIRDASQISAQLSAIPYRTVAVISEGQQGHIGGVKLHPILSLAAVVAVARIAPAGQRYGYIDLNAMNTGVDGIIHFPRPQPEAKKAASIALAAGTVQDLVRRETITGLARIGETQIVHPRFLDFSERVAGDVHAWQRTNEEKFIEFVSGLEDLSDGQRLYLLMLLFNYAGNTGRHSLSGSIVNIGFVPSGQFFEITTVDTFGYPYDQKRDYGSLMQHWEVSLRTLQERFGFEDIFITDRTALPEITITNNPDRPLAIPRIISLVLTALRHPERLAVVYNESVILPYIKVYYHDVSRAGPLGGLPFLAELHLEDFVLSAEETAARELIDPLFSLDGDLFLLLSKLDNRFRALAENEADGLAAQLGPRQMLQKIIVDDYRAYLAQRYFYKGIAHAILSARKELRFLNKPEAAQLLRQLDDILGLTEKIVRLIESEGLDVLPPSIDIYGTDTRSENLARTKQQANEVKALRDKIAAMIDYIPPDTKAVSSPLLTRASPGTAILDDSTQAAPAADTGQRRNIDFFGLPLQEKEDQEGFLPVGQGEFDIVRARDHLSVITSIGADPCVLVVIDDRENGISLLAHMDGNSAVADESYSAFFDALALEGTSLADVRIHLFGADNTLSRDTGQTIKSGIEKEMRRRGASFDVNERIKEDFTGTQSRSIGIDANGGIPFTLTKPLAHTNAAFIRGMNRRSVYGNPVRRLKPSDRETQDSYIKQIPAYPPIGRPEAVTAVASSPAQEPTSASSPAQTVELKPGDNIYYPSAALDTFTTVAREGGSISGSLQIFEIFLEHVAEALLGSNSTEISPAVKRGSEVIAEILSLLDSSQLSRSKIIQNVSQLPPLLKELEDLKIGLLFGGLSFYGAKVKFQNELYSLEGDFIKGLLAGQQSDTAVRVSFSASSPAETPDAISFERQPNNTFNYALYNNRMRIGALRMDVYQNTQTVVVSDVLIYPEYQGNDYGLKVIQAVARYAAQIRYTVEMVNFYNPYLAQIGLQIIDNPQVSSIDSPSTWFEATSNEGQALLNGPTLSSADPVSKKIVQSYQTHINLRGTPRPAYDSHVLATPPQEASSPSQTDNEKVGLQDASQNSLSIDSRTEKAGGIDFRALPVQTSHDSGAYGLFDPAHRAGPLKTSHDSGAYGLFDPAHRAGPLNLDESWTQIQNMIDAGIIPSSERLKAYLEACCSNENMNQEIDKVLSCIADILRLEEDNCQPTEAALKEMLVLIESDKPPKAMQAALINITALP
jgi:glycosyltransferase involved in cell wall biosynthesis